MCLKLVISMFTTVQVEPRSGLTSDAIADLETGLKEIKRLLNEL